MLFAIRQYHTVHLCLNNRRNEIDKQLELDLEILDDLVSEAHEVYEFNKWFSYGEPLHLLRQFGIAIKELDLLDECTLTGDQIRDVCCIL